jgi:hypothetical protein
VRKLLVLPFLLLLTACAALGVPKADTFNKQVVVANGIVESVATTAASLHAAGKISDVERTSVYNQGTEARAGIEVVRQLHATDPLSAENRLNTIIVALTALQTRLEAKQ